MCPLADVVFVFFPLLYSCCFFLHKSIKWGKERAGQNLVFKIWWLLDQGKHSYLYQCWKYFVIFSGNNVSFQQLQTQLTMFTQQHQHRLWENKVLTHCFPFWPTQNCQLWFCLTDLSKCPAQILSIEWNNETHRFCQNSNHVCPKQYFSFYHLKSYFKVIVGILYTAGCHAGIVELRQKLTWAKKTPWMTLKPWVLPSNGRICYLILH